MKKNSNGKKSVLVVTGTRAEYGLLRSTMDAIRAHKHLKLKLLATGMHTLKAYGYTKKDIVRDGYTLDCTVSISPDGGMLSALSREIEGIKQYCLKKRPDCILVLGDRDEAFAGAVVAAHLNIPLAHIHGGDVSGPGVDEALRHAITKMAHLHFPGSKNSAVRIAALGEQPWRIGQTGSVALDIFADELPKKREAVAAQLHLDASRPWLTVLQHPAAFDTAPLQEQIAATLAALERFPEHEKVILYPNSDTGSGLFIGALKKLNGPRYHAFPSLPRTWYVNLLRQSEALVGNSSSAVIELSAVGTPAVDIGNRQAGREKGLSVFSVPYQPAKIVSAINRAISLKKKNGHRPFPSPYGKGGAGKKIAAAIAKELRNPKLLRKAPPGSRK